MARPRKNTEEQPINLTPNFETPQDIAGDFPITGDASDSDNSPASTAAVNHTLKMAIDKQNVVKKEPYFPPDWRDFRNSTMRGGNIKAIAGKPVESPEKLLELNDADKKVLMLRHVDFTGSDLTDCDFSGMDLQGSRFINVKFGRANMSRCDLRWCDFTGADVSQVDFTGALVKESLGLSA